MGKLTRRQLLGAMPAVALAGTLGGKAEAAHLESKTLMGMDIEDVVSDGGHLTVQTPGAVVDLGRDGLLRVRQRIGSERDLIQLWLDGHFAPWKIGRRTPFLTTLEGQGLNIRVQGDSVLVFEPHQNMRLEFDGLFKPAYNRELRGNRLLLDNSGGCGFFGIPPRPTQLADTEIGWTCRCHLARWDELWVCVCPPRPEDERRMKQSISHDILYNLPKEKETGVRYPAEDALREIAQHCQILALHEEIWKDAPAWVDDPPGGDYKHPKSWETDKHIPFDAAAFATMRNAAHKLGLKIVPYCSPYYCNAPDIFGEMERVLGEYKMDGLYFDGWCPMRDDFRPGYYLMRRAREILGDRILYMHSSTDPFGSVDMYPPFAFTYADFCLRGEAGRGEGDLDTFLRYTVSGRQISNTVGMWCYYGSMGEPGYHLVVPTTEHVEAALRNGVRLWRQSWTWSKYPEELARFDRQYYSAIK